MEIKILSLNCGVPELIEWEGRSVMTSMRRTPITGHLMVHRDYIEGNTFAAANLHGLEHSVLYVYGMKSAVAFVNRLEIDKYDPGAVGENVTVDDLDETQVSVGDIFRIGDVLAQAVYPRIPCGKVNLRMQNAHGQKAMQECGRSGVYFRILKPGMIERSDPFTLYESAQHRFLISDLYNKMVNGIQLTRVEMELALANGAFPKKAIEKWTLALSS